jgi:hypothetical protein
MGNTMKKYYLILFLLVLSCTKDEIEIIDMPTKNIIFDMGEVSIQDGQDIYFEITSTEEHKLIISTEDGSVLTKETFQPEIGLNTRKIWTKFLPPNSYNLILIDSKSEVGRVKIIVE